MGIITEGIQPYESQHAALLENDRICLPNGFAYFDFGRSTPNEGTFKFKEQWGAVPHKLSWIYTSPGNEAHLSKGYDRSKYQRVIEYWKRLPVPLTILVGPILRKHIPL
jgi:hypothetical protein